jgi:hypothetical protein
VTAEEKFHAHLDECRQCREQVFNLCAKGLELLTSAATDNSMIRGLMQWNRVVGGGER